MSNSLFRKLAPYTGKALAPELDETMDGAGYPIPPSRRKKKAIMSWHDAEVSEQLKVLSKKENKTQQALLREAMNLLFAKYGKDQIA